MADPQSIIAINIGSQRVTMGVMGSTAKGGLVLKKYESSTILADPAAEMMRLPQVRIAISELAEKLGVSKAKVSYAISGQSVFTRFVKLPVLEDGDIEQLVTFEAQQHVPFPINEVVWDWQMLGESDGQQEVVLVAIKADALDDINDCVASADLETEFVDASPMALANAFIYSYADVEESVLLIDIGARTSNLVYKDGNKIFTRTIAIGGSTITSAIAKEYNVPFIEAESQKCSNGLVALDTRHTSTLDELTAALGSCIRTALNRMPAEIARTTNFFRSQHGGSAPKRVLLAGAGANLPMIADFFQEKLRLPVEFFNPLKRVSVGQGMDVERVASEAHMLGEIIGLGLRSIGKAKLQIDLVPEVVEEARVESKRRPKLLAAAAIAIAASAAYAVTGMTHKAHVVKQQKKNEKTLNGLLTYSKPIKNNLQKAKKVGAILSQYGSAIDSRQQAFGILDDINQYFSDHNLWIVDFDPIVNFTPGAEEQTSYVSDEMARPEYGKSSLAKLSIVPKMKGNRPNPAYKPTVISAIRIHGFWKGGDPAVVQQRFENLLAHSKYFTKQIMVKKGRHLTPEDIAMKDMVVEQETVIPEDKLAAPYTIIIPLSKPILIK